MKRAAPPGCILILIALGPAAAGADIQFNRDIRPILSDNCFNCHGPDPHSRKAKLRLDDREAALAAGSIKPGNAAQSPLLQRVLSQNPDQIMPPPEAHKTLTDRQKKLLEQWINSGAEYQPHWAYLPIRRPDVPRLRDTRHALNPIDHFIQEKLEQQNITPWPQADRATLLRRLSLDLTGLPPSREQVEAFVRDPAPDAYEKQVERLLHSVHYGERMAQHWLDVARYADTVGFHGDQNQNVWAYRDWVIQAFAQDLPFDRFTTEQLAGDLLPDPTPEQLVATCFNRLNMMTREGGAQPKEYLAKYTADRIRTVGMAWMGSTLGCAECHDHKFDPFSAKDFYAMGAFFADVKQWGVYADYSYTPNPDLRGWNNDYPWPPEIDYESPALLRKLAGLREDLRRLATQPPADPGAPAIWKQEALAFLSAHPSGWQMPAPTIRAEEKNPPKAKEGETPTPAASTQPDQAIHLARSARLTIDLTPDQVARIAAIRLELLPSESAGGKILRGSSSPTLKPEFHLLTADGKTRKLNIRFATAHLAAPRYSNGFEILGVHGGWKIDPARSAEPHAAIYLPDPPVEIPSGAQLRCVMESESLAAVRLSVSPLALAEPGRAEFPSDPASLLETAESLSLSWLRSTAKDAGLYQQLKRLEDQIVQCREGRTPVLVTQKTEKPLVIRVLARGNWMDETGEICSPQTPAFLPPLPDAAGRTLSRLDLARWLCAEDNPLTARVVMNRLWRQFFGTGLSPQVDDLGAQGEVPSHPELLDWLAVEFREKGWSTRHMVRQIVLSHTYRQKAGLRPELAERDPQNRLLASQNPRRLEAEIVRDNALAVSGLINLEVGGPPVKPYQPEGYYAALQFPDRHYVADRDANQYRRGVYMHWQRTFLHPMLANFDAPSREDCIAMRPGANSPQQALTLLNDPSFVEAARVWAARLLKQAPDDTARIRQAFLEALARDPLEQEQRALKEFLARVRTEYREKPENASRLLRIGLAPPPEGDAIELASWTSLCRVILNLHETITRY